MGILRHFPEKVFSKFDLKYLTKLKNILNQLTKIFERLSNIFH